MSHMETSSEISLLVDIYKVFINTFDVILILDPANGNEVFFFLTGSSEAFQIFLDSSISVQNQAIDVYYIV